MYKPLRGHTHNFHSLLHSLGELPRRGIAESFSKCINCQNVFQSGGTILHSHQQRMSVSVASHPCGLLILSVSLLIVSTLMYRRSNCGVTEAQLAFPDDQ